MHRWHFTDHLPYAQPTANILQSLLPPEISVDLFGDSAAALETKFFQANPKPAE
jgi:hypothetical protein